MHGPTLKPARPERTRRSLALFFAIALGFTWLLQAPALLAQWGVLPGGVARFFLLAALGGFGPLIAALIAAYHEGGAATLRELLRPARGARVASAWYAVALLASGATYVAGALAYRALGGGAPVRLLYLPENAGQIVVMVVVSLVEEIGWRGFALPRLQARTTRLRASLGLGAAWAAWHACMFALQGFHGPSYWAGMLQIVAGSILFSWLYNRAGGLLRIPIVAHMGAHLNNPGHALPDSGAPLAIHAGSLCALALALVLLDRPAWDGAAPAPVAR